MERYRPRWPRLQLLPRDQLSISPRLYNKIQPRRSPLHPLAHSPSDSRARLSSHALPRPPHLLDLEQALQMVVFLRRGGDQRGSSRRIYDPARLLSRQIKARLMILDTLSSERLSRISQSTPRPIPKQFWPRKGSRVVFERCYGRLGRKYRGRSRYGMASVRAGAGMTMG